MNDWITPADSFNWDSGVPDSADDVVFNADSGNRDSRISQDHAIASLSLDGFVGNLILSANVKLTIGNDIYWDEGCECTVTSDGNGKFLLTRIE